MMRIAIDTNILAYSEGVGDAARQASSMVLLSEDMQHGFTWRGVTVVNPYLTPTHPLLSSLLL